MIIFASQQRLAHMNDLTNWQFSHLDLNLEKWWQLFLTSGDWSVIVAYAQCKLGLLVVEGKIQAIRTHIFENSNKK